MDSKNELDMDNSERIQKEHYNKLAADYEKHYDDFWSQKYRRVFFYTPLFEEINLAGKTVLEGMCGSGQATAFLHERGARVIGLDISEKLIKSFKIKNPNETAICASILKTSLPDNSVDCVIIIGGLHHLHPNLSQAVNEVHRILKPGGELFFCEPHKGSLFDWIRNAWYKRDRNMFESNEASVDLETLKNEFSKEFIFEFEKYGGGPAYLFVCNSLVFRIPVFLKKFYSWPLFIIEYIFSFDKHFF